MRAARTPVFAFICFGLTLGTAFAQEALDTSRLPRSAGAREVFASASSTIYTTPDSVSITADAVRQALTGKGWQSYSSRTSAQAASDQLRIATFKKGAQALNVFITVAPAQNNATSVSYSGLVMKHDLPFPKDATDILFDPDRPMLALTTSGSIDDTLAFFRTELATLGWSRWNARMGALAVKDGPAGEMTERGAYSYYVREGGEPMILMLQRAADGRLKVDFKPVPANALTAETRKPAPQPVIAAPARPARDAADEAMDQIMKQTTAAIGQALADINKPAPKAQLAARMAQAEETLAARADSEASIPVPEKAESVEFDAEDGKLEFEIETSVKAVAAFYRNALKGQGWREKPSVINRPNMQMLEFSKGGKDISMTVMQMGSSVNFTASGTGLVNEAAVAAAIAKAPVEELEGEIADGLPVPTKRSSRAIEKTPLRKNLMASVDSPLKSVLAFYRRELTRMNWKEETAGAIEKSDQVQLAFTTPDGPAQLKLDAKGMKTEVSLSTRSQSAAKANSDMIPAAGQGKILFGNINETEASITINKKTVKIAAGAGSKTKNGPSMDVPPGKYSFSFRVGNKGPQTDQVEVKAGETWGLMVGPGGVLAVQIN